MTILGALAAIYPPTESWCGDLGSCVGDVWTPVPYTTVSPIYDYNLPFFNCPTYITAYTAGFTASYPQLTRYNSVLDEWSEIVNFNLTTYPGMSYVYFDAYTSQISLGIPLSEELEAIFPQIKEVTGAASTALFGDDEFLPLAAGVLLQEFFNITDEIISGETLPTLRIYSAHDLNVLTFMVVTKIIPLQGVPKYGAVYALELRKVVETGQYVVVPVYLSTPHEEELTYLQVEGCEELCDLDTFRDLVSGYELDETTWRQECDWSADYDFNYSSIS